MPPITPDRALEIELDPPDSVQVEPFFAKSRMYFEIRDPVLTDVEQLASGVWILKPQATNLFTLHETTAGQAHIVRLTEFNHPTQVSEIPLQRSYTELTGVSPAGAVSASGDHFYVKRIPALTTWSISLTPRYPVPTLPTTPNYPLDTVLQHNGPPDVADQGYVLRWIQPGHGQQLIDYVVTLLFGGELTAAGYGQFEVCFGGDGRAYLFEWIAGAWVMVDQWRYAASELVPGRPHVCRIIPHAGKFIEFKTNVTDRSSPGASSLLDRLTAFYGKSVSLDSHVYKITNRQNLPPFPGGLAYPVTGAGHPDFRVRQDVLLRWQLSRVTYPASGTLLDQPMVVPNVNLSTHVIDVRRFSMVLFDPLTHAQLGSTSAQVRNAQTHAALTPAAELWSFGGKTFTLNGATLAGKPNSIEVLITLTNNQGAGGPYSPWFFGYEARKVGENASNGLTALKINAAHNVLSPVTRLSITGPDADPSHESAAVRIQDLANRCGRLGTRGEGRIRITTSFDPGDQAQRAVLFDGYWIKSDGALRGKAGINYPSPSWSDYDLSCMGMWARLHERSFLNDTIFNLSADLNATTPPDKGQTPPSKVTDAIRFLMVAAGIPESQLDIPDLSTRLYPNQTEGGDTILIQPGTNCAEFVRHLASDYLNYFLVWCANAGTSGMWRLKPVPYGTEAPVWTFTDALPAAGRLATAQGAYSANTSWIARDTLKEWVVPPEGNWIRVTGTWTGATGGALLAGQTKGSSTMVVWAEADNPKAYNKPGANTADPNHPDYTDGRWRPIFRAHDPSLTGPTLQQAQAAVNFVTRRVFDLSCRAQRFARFTCPLPLINAAALEPSVYTLHKRRPLHYGDVVRYRNRPAMIRSCNIQIPKDFHQLATIELVLFNDPLPP